MYFFLMCERVEIYLAVFNAVCVSVSSIMRGKVYSHQL